MKKTLGEIAAEAKDRWHYGDYKTGLTQYIAQAVAREVRRRDKKARGK